MKSVALLVVIVLLVGLTACSAAATPATPADESQRAEVVVTQVVEVTTEDVAETMDTGAAMAATAAPEMEIYEAITVTEAIIIEAEATAAPAPNGGTVVTDTATLTDSTTGGAGTGPTTPPQQQVRRIIYTANLNLEVADPRLAFRTLQEQIAPRYGGFVSGGNIEEIEDNRYQANITVRVDANQFAQAMEAIRNLASEVLMEEITTQDVTAEYTDVRSRITNLEATEAEMRTLLAEARANTQETEEILRVYRELTTIREEIEVLQGRVNVLGDLTTYATINIILTAPAAPEPTPTVTPTPTSTPTPTPTPAPAVWNYDAVVDESTGELTVKLQNFAEVATNFVISDLPFLLVNLLILALILRIAWWLYRRFVPQEPRPTVVPPAETEVRS